MAASRRGFRSFLSGLLTEAVIPGFKGINPAECFSQVLLGTNRETIHDPHARRPSGHRHRRIHADRGPGAGAEPLFLAPLRHRRTALFRLHRGHRHHDQPDRRQCRRADRADAGRGRQQPRRRVPDRRHRAPCTRGEPGPSAIHRKRRAGACASRPTCRTATTSGSPSPSARGSSSTTRPMSKTRRRPIRTSPAPNTRAWSASAPPPTSTRRTSPPR
jgi:hypothetical protein